MTTPKFTRGPELYLWEVKDRFFFKQWGGANKKKAGRLLEGRTWDELPELRKTA